jgi:protein-tyrosine phosphatase
LDKGVDFIHNHVERDHKVLIHCAKGRGRSAAMLAAYLMRYEGMSYDEARDFLVSKRSLVNLQNRHQRVLEEWIKKYSNNKDDEIGLKIGEKESTD